MTAGRALLLIALFLAPVLGGQLSIGVLPMSDALSSLRGPELPLTAHAIIGSLVVIALALTFFRERVLQTPSQSVLSALVFFLGMLAISVTISDFRSFSLSLLWGWVACGAALLAACAVLGREKGPRTACWALAAGCAFVAVEGILEYAATRAADPSWRIFAGWANPNALAAMMLLGFFVAIGLVLATERLEALAAGTLAMLIGFALALTQSRGAFLAAMIGVLALGALLLFLARHMKSGGGRVPWLRALAVGAAVVLLVLGLRLAPSPSGGAAALGRVGDVQGTAVQSVGFRNLLWETSIALIQQRPIGFGLGTFRFESGRAGITPQTYHAHQGFLQFGVEAGALGLFTWLALLYVWARQTTRGLSTLPPSRGLLLAGILAAFAALCAHNMVDSGFQHFGIAFSLFALMGIGLQLAADGSAPESISKREHRAVALVGCALALLGLIATVRVEVAKSAGMADLLEGNSAQALATWRGAEPLAFGDGELRMLIAQAENAPDWAHAARAYPSTRNLRAAADRALAADRSRDARELLNDALIRDPNNLPTHLRLVRMAPDPTAARTALERMLRIEGTPYFLVRAVPELVPTETYEARLLVAERLPPGPERTALLEAAVAGLAEYARVTGPRVRALGGSTFGLGGETREDLDRKLALGERAVSELAAMDPKWRELEPAFAR